MRGNQDDLFHLVPRTGPYVAAITSVTLWIAAWMYFKRVADHVVRMAEAYRYYSHLKFLHRLLPDYPCPPVEQLFGVAFNGLAYFVMRPLLIIRCHARTALNGFPEKLAPTLVFLSKMVFSLSTVLVPSPGARLLARRLFLLLPIFIHPVFTTHFALTGASLWAVVAAALVMLGSTVATTELLLRASVPIHFEPFRICVQITLASLAAIAWAALGDGTLAFGVLLRRMRRDHGVAAAAGLSATVDSYALTGHTENAQEGPAGTLARAGCRCPMQLAGQVGTAAEWVGAASAGKVSAKRRHGSSVTASSRRMVPERVKLEDGDVQKRRRRSKAVSAREPSDVRITDDAADSDDRASSANACEEDCVYSSDFTESLASGRCRSLDGCGGVPDCQAIPLTKRWPAWLLSALGKCVTGGSARQGCPLLTTKVAGTCRSLTAPWPGKYGEYWVGATQLLTPPSAALRSAATVRRRFTSQIRRSVLRIRIVGADPDQLPADWREIVFAHFSGRDCNADAEGFSLANCLANGVAVRRGSIFLTVSLVQLPSQHDGGEGPSGAGDRIGRQNITAAAAAPASGDAHQITEGPAPAVASGASPRSHDSDASWASSRALGIGGHGQGHQDAGYRAMNAAAAATAAAAVAVAEMRAAYRVSVSQQQMQQQEHTPGHRLRTLVRTASAGVAGRQGAAAPTMPASSTDGPPGSHARNHTAGGTTAAPATAAGGNPAGEARNLSGSSRPYMAPQLQPAFRSAETGAGVMGNPRPLHGYYGAGVAGYVPGRRRIAGVWRPDRRTSFRSSSSPLSTPGNSNNPLLMLGPAAAASLCTGSPLPTGFAGGVTASPSGGFSGGLVPFSPPPAPAAWAAVPAGQGPRPGPGQGPGGSQQPMRYTPLLSPSAHAPIHAALGAAVAGAGAGGRTFSTETSPPQHYYAQYPYQLHPYPALHPHRGSAAGPVPAGGSVRTGGTITTGPAGSITTPTATTSIQVAQLLDAMQLRSRENTSREVRQGCALGVLSAVGQLDGGIPLHLRQVLGTRSWEGDEPCASSSWEGEGAYERPLPPPMVQLSHQRLQGPGQGPQAQAHVLRWMEEMAAAANGLFVLSDAPSPPPLGGPGMAPARLGGLMAQPAAAAAQRAQAASGLPTRTATGDPRSGPRGFGPQVALPGVFPAAPAGGYPGLAATAGAGGMWSAAQSHTGGLTVLAGPASLPVRDVAVKPILICKAPLVCAAAAGDLAASIPAAINAAAAAGGDAGGGGTDDTRISSGPDVGGALATTATAPDATAAPPVSIPGSSELELSLMCAPATVSELSVMLRYCGPASVFGEQTYLPVQLQLDSSSPAVAAAIRLQAAASDRDRHGGGDTQAARDVADAATNPLPAHATVRTVLSGLACPGVLYVELWHGPQLCACLPVLLLPESAAGWAHEVCSLWQQQVDEGEAEEALNGVRRAGAAAMPAAAHQVVEDLGGWLTYAAHKRYVAERALAAATAAAAVAVATSSAALSSLGIFRAPQYTQGLGGPHTGHTGCGGGVGASALSTTATISPPQMTDDWYSGWLGELIFTDAATASPFAPSPPVTAGFPMAVPGGVGATGVLTTGSTVRADAVPSPSQPHSQAQPLFTAPPAAASGAAGARVMPAVQADTSAGPALQAVPPPGVLAWGAGAAGHTMPLGGVSYDGGGVNGACNRELFHDMMLQEGYNWLADCVEAGCCGLAAALMDSLLAAGCTAGEVLRTCRSVEGLPLIHTAMLSGSPDMIQLVWGWGVACGMDGLGWAPPPGIPEAPVTAATLPPPLPPGTAGSGAALEAGGNSTQGAAQFSEPERALAGPGTDTGNGTGTSGTGTDSDQRTAAARWQAEAEILAARSGPLPSLLSRQPSGSTAAVSTAAAEVQATLAAAGRPSNPATDVNDAGRSSGGRAFQELYGLLPAKLCRRGPERFLLDGLRCIVAGLQERALSWHPPSRSPEIRSGTTANDLRSRTNGPEGDSAHNSLGPTRRGEDTDSVLSADDVGTAGWVGVQRWGWRRLASWLAGACAAALRMGDAMVTAVHSLVLRINVLHVDGGAEERRFLSYFQQHHGWVFSAWCWSMIPLYALILWRCLRERQWGQLALTPLWMWMYVVCAALDVAGATAAYRSRTEAIATAMHLSYSLSKALQCTGLPSYPMPAGRLYWLDVLACATLSALCEPVRLCVALPLRLINFAVSTALYRVAGTAPSVLEAMLLSASCHCFGLLMQHAVESHYRRTFAGARQQAAAAAGDPATLSAPVVAALPATAAAAAAAGATAMAKPQERFAGGLEERDDASGVGSVAVSGSGSGSGRETGSRDVSGSGSRSESRSSSFSRGDSGPLPRLLPSQEYREHLAAAAPQPLLLPPPPPCLPASFAAPLSSPSSSFSPSPHFLACDLAADDDEDWTGSETACITIDGMADAVAAAAGLGVGPGGIALDAFAAAGTVGVPGNGIATAGLGSCPDLAARIESGSVFVTFPQLQERDGGRIRGYGYDRSVAANGNAPVSGGSGSGGGGYGRRSTGLDSAVVDPREEFLLPDGHGDFADTPGGWPPVWQNRASSHAARQAGVPVLGRQSRSPLPPPPPPRPPAPQLFPPPRPQLELDLLRPHPQEQQQGQQLEEAKAQQAAHSVEGTAALRRWVTAEVQVLTPSVDLCSAEGVGGWEDNGRDVGCLRLSGLLQLSLPGSAAHTAAPTNNTVASAITSGGSGGGRSSSGSGPVRRRDSGSGGGISFVSRRGNVGGGGRGGGGGGGGTGAAGESVTGSNRRVDSIGGSDGSSAGRGSGGSNGSGRSTGAGAAAVGSSSRLSSGSSSRASGGSLRQLVSRATGWVAGTLRRRNPRMAGTSGRKAGIVS